LVLDVPMLEDAREVLAPAAVGALALLHPRAGAADLRVDGGHAAGEETAHAEHGPVDEVHAPDAGPASVGALAAAQHGDGALDGGVDLVAQDVRVAGAEGGERRDAGRGALDVALLRHARAEHLGGVEPLDRQVDAARLVAAEAAVA